MMNENIFRTDGIETITGVSSHFNVVWREE